MREERKAVPFRVNIKALDSLRILARKQKTTVNSMLIEGLNDLLAKHGRKPIAKRGVSGRPPSK